MMKRKMAIVCSTVLMASGLTAFAGCGSTEEEGKRVMNLALNPKVEFILDANDTVISVNALNEEGNLIVSAETFTGKSADVAAKLFVEVSAETGFLIEGEAYADDNKISVSFSGDKEKAKKLYNEVKSDIEEYLTTIDVSAQIEQAAAITEAQLKQLVEECAPYVETAKMKYSELLNTLEESRKETAELYSQELKNAYYEAKSFMMAQEEMEVLKGHLNAVEKLALETAYAIYENCVNNVEEIRKTWLVDEDSLYQRALAAFRKQKIKFLNYKNYIAGLPEEEVSQTHTEALAKIATALENAESSLLAAGRNANEQLDLAKDLAKDAFESAKKFIGDYAKVAKKYADEITAKQKEAKTSFYANFESGYATAKAAAENNWKNMKAALETGAIEE